MSMRSVPVIASVLAVVVSACSGNDSVPSSASNEGAGGSSGPSSSGGGGTVVTGGSVGSGGALGQGGSSTASTSDNRTGGAPSTGGALATGGASTSATGGVNATGGRSTTTSAPGTGGAVNTGGAGVAGASSQTGGATATPTGGSKATGGTSSVGVGGASTNTGGANTAGASAGGNSSTDVSKSAGCGKTRTLQNGTITLTYGGASRKYILKVPDSYDNTHAYRLVLTFAWSGASASQVVSTNYFTFATQDSKNTIFAAPDAANGAGSWSNSDLGFTDAILTALEGDLCIDKSRVFASGFSFGAGMAMALGCTRADVFRAVAFFSGADLTGSCPATLTKPIAYYASQASEDANGMDPTNPMTGEKKQSQFAAVNGCTAEPTATTFPTAGQPHKCTIYKNCSAGHPTEYCVFNGAHGWEPKDPGSSTSWDAPEAWKFITQF